jgi:5-methylcytosine-specific restriction protein A
MAKLSTLKPLVSTLAPRIGRMPADEKARDKDRSNSQPWRAWYKTAEWQKLRREVFARDHYTCQRTGELCIGRANQPNSPICNHKVPHRGDASLFWDINNLETVTKAAHDSIIQKEERRLYG